MIDTEQLALINGCIAGLKATYKNKHIVPPEYLMRYNKQGLLFSVGMKADERILTVLDDHRGRGFSFNEILQVNLGYVVPATDPNGPTDTTGDAVEFKMAEAA
jgi:hypothetical protein